jgi:MoxR-like ATPase
VIITSNNEKELPDAFLRRCLFHFIRFPEEMQMKEIVDVHHPGLKEKLLNRALSEFYRLRKVNGIKKRPSTSELVDWISLLLRDDLLKDEAVEGEQKKLPPHLGSLIKNEQDLMLLERMFG